MNLTPEFRNPRILDKIPEKKHYASSRFHDFSNTAVKYFFLNSAKSPWNFRTSPLNILLNCYMTLMTPMGYMPNFLPILSKTVNLYGLAARYYHICHGLDL